MKTKKLTLVICMLSSILSFFGCNNFPKENNVTVTELHDVVNNPEVIVLDVRTPKEIAQGKIKSDALEADFFENDFVAKVTAQLPKDKDVYVYCKGGTRSAKAVIKLRELGYLKTHNVEGGINAWKAKGYKVE
ncbi:rhodanese-like domain-containing protein [uncultured Kordia sp.]|uniref:rhodanese-like domain-containing protein n=1 Tax=uncultured Kordia sp. TaxID=507699 RepID=UPI00261E54B0|nr:rhodanese-like domain-containing protein [uncultured Kordia sp.]